MLSYLATAVVPGAIVGGVITYTVVLLMHQGIIFARQQPKRLGRNMVEAVVLLLCLPFVMAPFFLILLATSICQCRPSGSPYLALSTLMVGFLVALAPSFRRAWRFNQRASV
jgi:nitric oxide reductase large subunit